LPKAVVYDLDYVPKVVGPALAPFFDYWGNQDYATVIQCLITAFSQHAVTTYRSCHPLLYFFVVCCVCASLHHVLCAQIWTADTEQGAIPRLLSGDDGTDGHFLKAHRRYVGNAPPDTMLSTHHHNTRHGGMMAGTDNISSSLVFVSMQECCTT
jgi:hypothetical protein